jgi:hypothetical protein
MKGWCAVLVIGSWILCGPAWSEPDPVGGGPGAASDREEANAKPAAKTSVAEARAKKPGSQEKGGALGCPSESEPARLEIAEIETVINSCEKTGLGQMKVQHGPWEKRRSGVLVESGAYRDGLRHGSWTYHLSSGQPQSAGEYHDGVKRGVWVFWDAKGDVLREVDYGAPETKEVAEAAKEGVTGIAEGQPGEEVSKETEKQTTIEISVRVENSRNEELLLSLEPSGEKYAVPPGTSFEVSAVGPRGGRVVVESFDEGISLWAWEGSEMRVHAGDAARP